jgi:UDPglucose--hexose-1-phosphate uridylyltransferase
VPSRTLAAEDDHWKRTGRVLLDEWLKEETAAATRVVARHSGFLTVCPFFARYPYESWIVPTGPWTTLADMSPDGLDSLAEAVHAMSRAYERLFDAPVPLMMALHQAPTDGVARPWTRLRLEFLPLQRTREKLKYLAGVESSAGNFLTDTLPEECAGHLRRALASR